MSAVRLTRAPGVVPLPGRPVLGWPPSGPPLLSRHVSPCEVHPPNPTPQAPIPCPCPSSLSPSPYPWLSTDQGGTGNGSGVDLQVGQQNGDLHSTDPTGAVGKYASHGPLGECSGDVGAAGTMDVVTHLWGGKGNHSNYPERRDYGTRLHCGGLNP